MCVWFPGRQGDFRWRPLLSLQPSSRGAVWEACVMLDRSGRWPQRLRIRQKRVARSSKGSVSTQDMYLCGLAIKLRILFKQVLCVLDWRLKLKKPTWRQRRRWCREYRWRKRWPRRNYLIRRLFMRRRSERWRENWYFHVLLFLHCLVTEW